MKISCIIPAYNEANRIGAVLDVITQCKDITEIIVVDDCSKDSTIDIIKNYQGVILLRHQCNQGKSISIFDGIQASSGELLVCIDADLIGLTEENIKQLIRPVVQREAGIAISLRGNAPWIWKYIGIDYISGERCFHRDLINGSLGKLAKLNSFGLEVFLNKIVIKNKLRIKVVAWPNVASPFKRKRFGIYFDFLVMGINILKEISPLEVVMQIMKMNKMKK